MLNFVCFSSNSPDLYKLKSIEEVSRHMSSSGTCKCGLRCPFRVEEVFSFDATVLSLPDHISEYSSGFCQVADVYKFSESTSNVHALNNSLPSSMLSCGLPKLHNSERDDDMQKQLTVGSKRPFPVYNMIEVQAVKKLKVEEGGLFGRTQPIKEETVAIIREENPLTAAACSTIKQLIEKFNRPKFSPDTSKNDKMPDLTSLSWLADVVKENARQRMAARKNLITLPKKETDNHCFSKEKASVASQSVSLPVSPEFASPKSFTRSISVPPVNEECIALCPSVGAYPSSEDSSNTIEIKRATESGQSKLATSNLVESNYALNKDDSDQPATTNEETIVLPQSSNGIQVADVPIPMSPKTNTTFNLENIEKHGEDSAAIISISAINPEPNEFGTNSMPPNDQSSALQHSSHKQLEVLLSKSDEFSSDVKIVIDCSETAEDDNLTTKKVVPSHPEEKQAQSSECPATPLALPLASAAKPSLDSPTKIALKELEVKMSTKLPVTPTKFRRSPSKDIPMRQFHIPIEPLSVCTSPQQSTSSRELRWLARSKLKENKESKQQFQKAQPFNHRSSVKVFESPRKKEENETSSNQYSSLDAQSSSNADSSIQSLPPFSTSNTPFQSQISPPCARVLTFDSTENTSNYTSSVATSSESVLPTSNSSLHFSASADKLPSGSAVVMSDSAVNNILPPASFENSPFACPDAAIVQAISQSVSVDNARPSVDSVAEKIPLPLDSPSEQNILPSPDHSVEQSVENAPSSQDSAARDSTASPPDSPAKKLTENSPPLPEALANDSNEDAPPSCSPTMESTKKTALSPESPAKVSIVSIAATDLQLTDSIKEVGAPPCTESASRASVVNNPLSPQSVAELRPLGSITNTPPSDFSTMDDSVTNSLPSESVTNTSPSNLITNVESYEGSVSNVSVTNNPLPIPASKVDESFSSHSPSDFLPLDLITNTPPSDSATTDDSSVNVPPPTDYSTDYSTAEHNVKFPSSDSTSMVHTSASSSSIDRLKPFSDAETPSCPASIPSFDDTVATVPVVADAENTSPTECTPHTISHCGSPSGKKLHSFSSSFTTTPTSSQASDTTVTCGGGTIEPLSSDIPADKTTFSDTFTGACVPFDDSNTSLRTLPSSTIATSTTPLSEQHLETNVPVASDVLLDTPNEIVTATVSYDSTGSNLITDSIAVFSPVPGSDIGKMPPNSDAIMNDSDTDVESGVPSSFPNSVTALPGFDALLSTSVSDEALDSSTNEGNASLESTETQSPIKTLHADTAAVISNEKHEHPTDDTLEQIDVSVDGEKGTVEKIRDDVIPQSEDQSVETHHMQESAQQSMSNTESEQTTELLHEPHVNAEHSNETEPNERTVLDLQLDQNLLDVKCDNTESKADGDLPENTEMSSEDLATLASVGEETDIVHDNEDQSSSSGIITMSAQNRPESIESVSIGSETYSANIPSPTASSCDLSSSFSAPSLTDSEYSVPKLSERPTGDKSDTTVGAGANNNLKNVSLIESVGSLIQQIEQQKEVTPISKSQPKYQARHLSKNAALLSSTLGATRRIQTRSRSRSVSSSYSGRTSRSISIDTIAAENLLAEGSESVAADKTALTLPVSIPLSLTKLKHKRKSTPVNSASTISTVEIGDIVWARAPSLPGWPGEIISANQRKGRPTPPPGKVLLIVWGNNFIKWV